MNEPPWMPLAWADLGLREIPGSGTNPRIAAYFRDAGHAEIRDDETAWCAAFVGALLERSGHRGTRSLMARSYAQWGKTCEPPARGAIAVLSRGSDPSLGHVGFLIALTPSTVVLLGGNQSNSVSVETYDRRRLIALRWPSSAATPQPASPAANASTTVAADPDFDRALSLILTHEGGWTDDPFDPGGATNKGITLAEFARETRRDVTADTIATLKFELRRIPDDIVRRIYLERYWRPSRCPDLPASIALFHVDTAVNMGVRTATRLLQEALGVTIDGDIGPETLAAARSKDHRTSLERYADVRRRRYRSLSHFWRFGRGWLARTDATLAAAIKLVGSPKSSPTLPASTRKETPDMPSDTNQPELPTSPTQPTTASPTAPTRKWWGESLTVWGALLTAATTVAPAIFATLGISMPAELIAQLGRDAITAFQALAGLAGTVMAIAGRIRASQPLEARRLTVRL